MPTQFFKNGDLLEWTAGADIVTPAGTATTGIFGSFYWNAQGSGQPVVTISQEEFAIDKTIPQGTPRYYMRVSPATFPSLSGTDRAYLEYQVVEDGDRPFHGAYGIFTFWCRSSTAKEIVVRAMRDFGTGGSNVLGNQVIELARQSFQLPSAAKIPAIDGWKKYEVKVRFDVLPGVTWGTSPSIKLRIYLQGGSGELGGNGIGWVNSTTDFAAFSFVRQSETELPVSRLSGTTSVESRRSINVVDYGAVGDGVTDDTVAIAAAYAALSSTNGGELFFPTGTWKFNLVITTPNVTITGVSHLKNSAATPHTSYFKAADITRPVIQVGNDTGYARGTLIREVSLDGSNGGQIGIYFAGGAFECTMQNCAVTYFKTCIKVQGGTIYPASLIYFIRVDGHPDVLSDNCRGWLIKNTSNYPTSYTTEIVLSDCHWDGPGNTPTNSYLMEIDSVEVKLVNCYFDIQGNHGIKIFHNFTPLPFLNALDSNLDSSGGPSSVAIEGYSNDRNFTGLSSINFQINGSWKEADGTIIAPLAQPIKSILRKSTATRGTFILLNQGAADGTSLFQFRDQVNNKNPDIFAQLGSLNIRAENGAAVKFGNISGSTWAQCNGTDGAFFFFGAGISANTFPLFDANRQLKSATSTGTGTTLVLSTAPTITQPTFIGGTLAPVTINSPAAQTIAVLNLVDTVNSKTVQVWGQDGSIFLVPLTGGATKLTDFNGTSKFQVNGADGATFFFGAGISASTVPYFDANRQLKSAPMTASATDITMTGGLQVLRRKTTRTPVTSSGGVLTFSMSASNETVTHTQTEAIAISVFGAAADVRLRLEIVGNGSGITWGSDLPNHTIGTALPASIASGKVALFELECPDSTDANVRIRYLGVQS